MMLMLWTTRCTQCDCNQLYDQNTSLSQLSTMFPLSKILDIDFYTNTEEIYKAVINSMYLSAPIHAMFLKENFTAPEFKQSDILEVLQPIKINELFYSFQPNRKTLEFINNDHAFLVILTSLKKPSRIELSTPPNYTVLPPLEPTPPPSETRLATNRSILKPTSGVVGTSRELNVKSMPEPNTTIGKAIVYFIRYTPSAGSTVFSSNTIYVQNQPIFTISNVADTSITGNTILHLSECNDAALTPKGVYFIYGRDAAGEDLAMSVDYTKNFCSSQYLIKMALIDTELLEATKITQAKDKKAKKSLIDAVAVLKNLFVRTDLVKKFKACSVRPVCICKDMCNTKTSCFEKVCPTTPIECLKYCLRSTVNSFLAMKCAREVCAEISWSSICYLPVNYGNSDMSCNNDLITQTDKIESLKMLFSKIYNCKSIFEVRVLHSMYLSLCIQTNGLLPENMFLDCEYDMLRCSYGYITDSLCNVESVIEPEKKDANANDSDSPSSSENEKKKKSSKAWVWVTVSIAVVAVVSVVGYFSVV